MYKILDGKKTAQILKEKYSLEVDCLISNGTIPCLAIIWDDNNIANNVYVKQKIRLCNELSIATRLLTINELGCNEELLIRAIEDFNNDETIHGVLVQLPLPKEINESKILESISKDKDVDCFNLYNIGKIWSSKVDSDMIKPCTPEGIIQLLKINNITIQSKNVVIVNRSNIVGKPLAALFLLENATVTICHSKTSNLKQLCKEADILVCGIGKQNFFDKSYFKENAVIIDVSINRCESGKLCGDVDVSSLDDFNGYLTPVPGGVGPMTVSTVIKNLIFLAKTTNTKGKK